MLIFLKFVDETKMPKPQEYTNTFIVTKKLFLVGLRGLQNISNPVERPCTYVILCPTGTIVSVNIPTYLLIYVI